MLWVLVDVDVCESQSAFLRAGVLLMSDSSVCTVHRNPSRVYLLCVHPGWSECTM